MKKYWLAYFLCSICFTGIFTAKAQPGNIWFENYLAKDGLSGEIIHAIYQDKKGYMWFGTNEGLNKFDAYRFTAYRHIADDPSSISNNIVYGILEDDKENLWVATHSGLNLFHRESGTFTRFMASTMSTDSLSNNYIQTLFKDKLGNIWLGTWDGLDKMLVEYTKDNKVKSVKFKHHILKPEIKSNPINSLAEDAQGLLWVAKSKKGFYSYDTKTEKSTFFQYDSINENSISHENIKKVYKDNENKIWFATWGGGLNLLNDGKDGFIRFPKSTILNQNEINTVFEDSHKNFWLGTEGGLLLYDRKKKTYVEYLSSERTNLSKNNITRIFEDKDQGMWIGTFGGGVNYFNLRKQKFEYIKNISNGIPLKSVNRFLVDTDESVLLAKSNGISVFNPTNLTVKEMGWNKNHAGELPDVRSLFKDSQNCLYVGMNKGLGLYKIVNDNLVELPLPLELKNLVKNSLVMDVLTDKNNNTWIATDDKGLIRLDAKNQLRQFYKTENPHSLWDNKVYKLIQDSKGEIWATVNGSVEKILQDGNGKVQFIHYGHSIAGEIGLKNRWVRNVLEDQSGNLWLSTNMGLSVYFKAKQTLKTYTVDDGLPSNDIMGVLEDGKGNLWISSNNGLSKFNPSKRIFRNYGTDDGLMPGAFIYNACEKTKEGVMYFGGHSGFVYFHPDSIKEARAKPAVFIIGFKIFNKYILPGSGSVLKNEISETKEISLSHEQSVIGIEFSALNYHLPQKNQFAYMLEGFDKEWIYSGQRREASYSNLPSGSYIFRVKASSYEGTWNEKGVSLRIIILPPYWSTWWFRLLVILIISAVAYWYLRRRIMRVEKQNRMLQKLVAERTSEIEQQKKNIIEVNEALVKLNATKDKFFSIIAHDLKNPFQGILFLSNELANNFDSYDEVVRNKFAVELQNSSQGAYDLLENLLNWASSQTQKIKFEPEIFDLHQMVEAIVNVLKLNAVNKNIHLSSTVTKGMKCYGDKNMLAGIIRNLVHNGIKFTQSEGQVIISAARLDTTIEIFVEDTGLGMDEKTKETLFKIDQQTFIAGTIGEPGTGLGLIICKEFIDKHQGNFNIESSIGKGSRFVVSIPNPDFLLDEAAIIEAAIIENNVQESDLLMQVKEEILEEERDAIVYKKSILIVEDNAAIRLNIKSVLAAEFEISEAENGKAGLAIALDIMPDLIISDLMMPEMNGFELCRFLKTDERSSHIPVILLTSSISDANKMVGLETGADDYITKPFNAEVLIVRVKNLIKSREELRRRFSREVKLEASEISITSADENFLNKAIALVESNLEESELSVTQLSDELNMSRVQLYRKLHGLTGLPPNEFIRTIRLKRAAQLLAKSGASIKEIAFSVGFKDPSYFGRAFRKQFGLSPSEYMVQNSEEKK